MNSRERVTAALTFGTPDRVPRDLWVLPYVSLFRKQELDSLLERFPLDFGKPELSPGSDDQDLQKYARPGSYTDEWGSVWHLAEPGIVGEVKQPVLADWSRLASYRPPWDFIRSRDWDHVNRLCGESDKFMISGRLRAPLRAPAVPAGNGGSLPGPGLRHRRDPEPDGDGARVLLRRRHPLGRLGCRRGGIDGRLGLQHLAPHQPGDVAGAVPADVPGLLSTSSGRPASSSSSIRTATSRRSTAT